MNIQRVTAHMIEGRIVTAEYELRADGRTTLCEVRFDNGWTERGEASCNLPEDFDAERGRAAARADAIRKAWPHFTFLAREEAFRASRGEAMSAAVSEKHAPVQGYTPGIPWSLHLEAYDAYCKKWSPQPALIDLEGRNCRGGFHTGELDEFIPGWRNRCDEIARLRARVAQLEGSQ
jgi:hypothetical protein